MKNNPFVHKGYVEIDGVLSKAGLVNPDFDVLNLASAVVTDTYMSVSQNTDEQRLNKTERAYLLRLRSLYSYVGIQNVTLKLGDDCRYTPDFSVLDGGRFVFHEVKGFMRDDALVKLKVAARQFPMFPFVLARKNGSGWNITQIKP